MRKGCDLSPRPSHLGRAASPLIAVVIVHSKATFVFRWVLASPRSGRRERGFPVLHYNPAMPIKNIIPGQTVAKEKLQRARELRRDMTPVEKILWQELLSNKLGIHFRRQQVTPALACWCKCRGIHP